MSKKQTSKASDLKSLKSKSESFILNLIKTSKELFWQCDTNQRIIYINPHWTKVFGYKKSEMMGKKFSEFQPENSASSNHINIDEVLREESLKGFETIVLSKAGKPIHLYFNPQIIDNDEGAITGTIGTAYDITEIKKTDRLMTENEQRLRNILEHSSNVFYSHTTEHVLTYLSPQIEDLLGYKPAEAMIKWTDLATDNPINEIGFQFTVEAIKTGKAHPPYELELKHKNGTKVFVEIREAPIVENGKTVSIVGALVDITARKKSKESLKESELRFKSLFDNSPVSLWEEDFSEVKNFLDQLKKTGVTNFRKHFDENPNDIVKSISLTKVIDINDTTLKLYHAKSKKQLIDNVSQLFVDDSLAFYKEELIALSQGKTFFQGESVNKTFSGNLINIHISWIIPPGYEESLSRVLISIVDISKEKKAEDALKSSENKYRSLFEYANDAIFLMRENIFVDCNTKTEQMFGYSKNEMLGITPDQVSPKMQPDGVKSKDKAIEKISAAFNGIPQFFEWVHLKKNGLEFQAEVSLNTVHIDNEKMLLAIVRDISERKQVEESLIKSESRFRTLIENAPVGIWLANKDGKGEFINAKLAEIAGLSYDQAKGDAWALALHPDDREAVYSAWISFVNGESPYRLTYRFINKEGKISWVAAQASMIETKSKEKLGFIGTLTDITESKNAEVALSEKEKHYRTLFNLSPAGILIEDADGNILDVNESFCRHSGYNREELIGENVVVLGPNERYEDIKHNISQILDGKILEHDVINKKKDGTLGYLQLRECSITLPNGALGLISVANDITDRKNAEQALLKSEKRYRMFFEEDISGNYISTPDGRILDCNLAFVQMFGFSSKEDALSFEPKNLYPDPKKREKFLSELKEKKSIDLWGYELRKKDGSPIFIAERTIGIFDNDGQLKKIQGYIFDITDLIKTQAELIKAKEAAEGANRLKDAFIANMSHEIRTPLNGILGMTSLIKERVEQYLSKNDFNYFSAIDIASNRIIRTIDMILNFSRLQVGDFPTNYNLINVTKILTHLVDEYKFTAERKSLAISFENNLGQVNIYADEYSFTQAVSNLIDNAIKYTREGYIKIILTQNSSGKLVIFVKDSGVGISEEYIENLFQPYTQEESGYSRAYDGVGLGLSLVKKFLDLNKAEISVSSEKGKGTTFTITIDDSVNRDANIDSSQELIPLIGDKKEIETSAIHTVLIVEDDSVNQGFMKAILNRRGNINSLCAYTAQEALVIIEAEKVDLILMDISLGGEMDGLELTKSLRKSENFSKIPIIAVTAHAFPADRQIIMDAGCDDYLAKPFSSKELVEKINIILK